MLDTQLAEIVMTKNISHGDSTLFLVAWKAFVRAFKNNDINVIKKLSLTRVDCPEYYNKVDQYGSSRLVSLDFFINAPYRNLYQAKILPIINSRKYTNNFSVTSDQDGNISSYQADILAAETNKHYVVCFNYSFEFIKQGHEFKFKGLTVHEWGWQRIKTPLVERALYFPLQQKKAYPFINLQALDTFTNRWYSEMLDSMKEPKLYNYHGPDDVYRFTWLRSFNNPVSIRIEKDINTIHIITKVLYGSGGDDADTLRINAMSWLSVIDWFKIQSSFSVIDFWKLPVFDPNEEQGNDGAEWILEAYAGGQYHFTQRWSPGGDYRKCCLDMIALSAINGINDKDIY